MSEQVSLIIRSADQTRKAAVQLPINFTVEELLQTTKKHWNLPWNTNYAVRLERTGQQLDPINTLEELNIEDNDILEIFPILEAG
jgi:hypothetical protein